MSGTNVWLNLQAFDDVSIQILRDFGMWSIPIYLWFDGAIAEAWITWEIVLFKCFLNP